MKNCLYSNSSFLLDDIINNNNYFNCYSWNIFKKFKLFFSKSLNVH